MKEHRWDSETKGERFLRCLDCGGGYDRQDGSFVNVDGTEGNPAACVPVPVVRPMNARVELVVRLEKAIELAGDIDIPPHLRMDVAFMRKRRAVRERLEKIKRFSIDLCELRAENAAPIPLGAPSEERATEHVKLSAEAMADALAHLYAATEYAKDGTGRKTAVLDDLMGGLVNALLGYGTYLALAEAVQVAEATTGEAPVIAVPIPLADDDTVVTPQPPPSTPRKKTL